MTFDYTVATAVTTHDISVNVEQSSAAVELARAGLVKDLACTVFITEVTAQAVGLVTFVFEYSTDNGTTYHDAGAGEMTAPATKKQISFPIGFQDIIPEQNAAADIQWRVSSRIASVIVNADDFSWQAYLGSSHYPSVIN